MEYCEKSTLRNCIDAGLYQDMDRVWRLFREMVEGLLHIHEQVNLPIRFCKGIKGQDLMIIVTRRKQRVTIKMTLIRLCVHYSVPYPPVCALFHPSGREILSPQLLLHLLLDSLEIL